MSAQLRKNTKVLISCENSHVRPLVVLEALTAAQARKRPHKNLATIWEQLLHIVFWQEVMLNGIRGKKPKPVPHASDSWPKIPQVKNQDAAWKKLIKQYSDGIDELMRSAANKDLLKPTGKTKRTNLDRINCAAQHASYHLGQIVTLRRMMGSWPPPSGGATW